MVKVHGKFRLPVLTDSDWEDVFSNISLITFFQGVPIGVKEYNNYSIASSTTNREYVKPEELYFSGDDINFHKIYCEKCSETTYTAYRSAEYMLKEFKSDANNFYYYMHDNQDTNSETACYYCLVNRENFKKTENSNILSQMTIAYYEALARERYFQKQNIEGHIGVKVKYYKNLEPNAYIVKEVNNINPNVFYCDIGADYIITDLIPTANTFEDINWNLKFVNWNTEPDGSGQTYSAGDVIGYLTEDIELYAQWTLDITSLQWQKDYLWTHEYGQDELFNDENYTTEEIGAYIWENGNRKLTKVKNRRWTKNATGLVFKDENVSYVYINSDGTNNEVKMTGNSINPGKGMTWAIFNGKTINHYDTTEEEVEVAEISNISFDYDIEFGDSFYAGGLIFNLLGEEDGSNTISGYMLSLNNASRQDSIFGKAQNNASVWYFECEKGDRIGKPENNKIQFTESECTHITDLDIPKNGTIVIRVLDEKYDIYYKATDTSPEILKYSLDVNTNPVKTMELDSNSFGFFSSHYKHSCNRIGRFELKNIVLKAKFLPVD